MAIQSLAKELTWSPNCTKIAELIFPPSSQAPAGGGGGAPCEPPADPESRGKEGVKAGRRLGRRAQAFPPSPFSFLINHTLLPNLNMEMASQSQLLMSLQAVLWRFKTSCVSPRKAAWHLLSDGCEIYVHKGSSLSMRELNK